MYAKGEYVRAFHEVIKIAPVTLPKLNLGDLDVAPAAGLGEYLPWCNVNRSFGRNGLPQWPRLSRRQCVQATRRSAVPLVFEFIRIPILSKADSLGIPKSPAT
jgi:hypothetical protein